MHETASALTRTLTALPLVIVACGAPGTLPNEDIARVSSADTTDVTLAGDVNGPASTNTVSALTGVAGLVSMSSGVHIVQQQGGQLPTPSAEQPLRLVPLDPNRGSFGMWFEGMDSSGTIDTTAHWGYNFDGLAGTEPQLVFSVENDWFSGNIHYSEMHIQGYIPAIGQVVRPFTALFRRDNGDVSAANEINGAGLFTVEEHTSGKTLLKANAGEVIAGSADLTTTFTAYGSVATVQTNNFRLYDGSFNQRAQICSGASDFLKVGPVGDEYLSVDATGIKGNVAYVPANPADWSGNPPATVQEALDRLAAKLGPIP